ncbi:MAG: response regulator transcription factor [Lachnospiraceae bacterium]|nr:response regulator transcription factor [Lachnospiraceae bacterium]
MRILIVDDDPFVSESLKVILEAEDDIEVADTLSSGAEAVEYLKKNRPDVSVMDIRMDGMNGLEAAEAILKNDPEAKILFLTTFLDDEYINKALKIGAKGYIIKQDCKALADSCRAVAGGQIVFGGKIVDRLPDLLNRKERFCYEDFDINEKERQLIENVADGLSNKEIADKMFLSEGTVRNMMSTVLSKLDLRDRTQLACFYYQKIRP